jgi:hypothetical protein
VFTNLNGLKEGKHLTKPVFAKIKPLAILLIILTSTMITLSFLPEIKAETKIIYITPYEGNVGETVQLRANITTPDGEYIIHFDGQNVTSGNATGIDVDTSFTVPSASVGSHNVMIIDVNTGENDTAVFTILTSYSMEIDVPERPKQLQEGDPVPISVNITEGESNKTFVANITVQAPTNTSYTSMLDVTTSNVGNGSATVVYPEDFPIGASTNFTGEYKVFFNGTLAAQTFIIGLTNSTEYHRFQYVDIKAAGYKPKENATITITFGEKIIPPKRNVTATEAGIIHANWTVPSNASIGDYNVTMTSETPTKPIRDSQLFSVPGYQIDVYTRNLAEDVVPQILVEALDEATNTTYSNTTKENGLACLWLEKGNHTFEAFWNNKVKVNETQVIITEEDTYNLTCELTNMKITVKDKNEIRIPFVSLTISYQYNTTKDNKVENGSRSGETDLSGVFFLNSTLPRITYTVNASRYERVFNTTVEYLPAEKWFNITILCPAKTLTLNITEHHRNPLPNARIELIEQMGGISYNDTTNDAGIATINCTFGNYTVKVYVGNIFLNRTFIEVFNDTHIEIYCKLYNLTVSVKIVDYFGQPIPNANVTLRREGLSPRPNTTKSDGVATFSDFIGGSVQITVYLNDQTQPCIEKTFSVESSTTIGIKIEKYVLVVGILVETSHLATALVIVATIILILSIEIYRRKHVKPQKSSSRS